MNLLALGAKATGAQIPAPVTVAQSDGVLQDLLDLFDVRTHRFGGCLQHLATPADQMGQTRLAGGLIEHSIDAPAVGADDSVVVFPQNRRGLLEPTPSQDR